MRLTLASSVGVAVAIVWKLSVFIQKGKCLRSRGQAGCWHALRSPVSPLCMFRVCRGLYPVETQVSASQLANAPLVMWLRCLARQPIVWRLVTPVAERVLSVVLQVQAHQCGKPTVVPTWETQSLLENNIFKHEYVDFKMNTLIDLRSVRNFPSGLSKGTLHH